MNDFLIDIKTGKLEISQGDFRVGDAGKVHQSDLIQLSPGDIAEDPTACVGMVDYILDDGSFYEFRGRISTELKRDGCKLKKIQGNNYQNLLIDADY